MLVEIERSAFPVLNFSVGGLLFGDAVIGFARGQRLFLKLFQDGRPNNKTFLYGTVVRVDIFDRTVAIDFTNPSDHAFSFIEGFRASASRFQSGKPVPKINRTSLLKRILDSF